MMQPRSTHPPRSAAASPSANPTLASRVPHSVRGRGECKGYSSEYSRPAKYRTAMYDDASWYSSFVPRAVKPVEKPKHRRRESRLEQPSVSPPS